MNINILPKYIQNDDDLLRKYLQSLFKWFNDPADDSAGYCKLLLDNFRQTAHFADLM